MKTSHRSSNGRVGLGILCLTFLAALAYADALDDDMNFSRNDGGAPMGDCPTYGACCALGTNGLLPRSAITAQAIVAAKAGQCDAAVVTVATTQCHNGEAAQRMLNNPDRVCATLASW